MGKQGEGEEIDCNILDFIQSHSDYTGMISGFLLNFRMGK